MPRLALLLALLALPAAAAPPKVVADIAPVQSLVAQVMDGVGEPALLITQGAEPHHVSLRPSQARRIAGADLVVWVGPELTPWLGDALDALAGGDRLALLHAPATRQRLFSKVEAQDQGDIGGLDPHAWLAPDNAAAWLSLIAEKLAALDPDNAARYRANAERAGAGIAALKAQIKARLAPFDGAKIVTFHDAFGYFAESFGLTVAGAVRPGDATAPSAASIARLKRLVADAHIGCAFSEPAFDPALLDAVAGKAGIRIGVLDPTGAEQPPGPGNYAATLKAMANAVASCLGG